MASFPTYGLIGIGIASAIGFVFALSFLGNNASLAGQPEESFLLTTQLKQTDGQRAADSQAGAPEASLMMEQAEELRPALTSITALQTNREPIGEVVPDMQFEINKPVLIEVSLVNPNEAEIRQHTIVLGVRAEGGSDEQLVSFQGDIAANGNTTLELYWLPDAEGSYTIVLFSMTPNDQAPQPIVEIPVRVG